MKAMALCLRKIYTILLYPILNKKFLKLTMDIRLRTPYLWKGLELVRISSDGTYLIGPTHTAESGHNKPTSAAKMHVRLR